MRLPPTEAFAETYSPPGVKDAHTAIETYREYQREWASTELGSQAIATRMEIPRGRIRSWEAGSKPDVVRGIETAREHGWVDQSVDSASFAALNRLVASVFSGGSISTETYEPSFSAPDDAVDSQLRTDLDTLGAGCRRVFSNSGNVEELRADSNATVLGRVLVALGAPQGPKAETVDRLPTYLTDAPASVRQDFAAVYVTNRGVDVASKPFIQIQEQRPDHYLDAVADVINDVVTGRVWRGDRSIRVDDDAASELVLDSD